MNIRQWFNKYLPLLSAIMASLIIQTKSIALDGQITFKTQIIRGTCEFDDSSDLSQLIDFSSSKMFVATTLNEAAIKDPISIEKFSYIIKCTDFPSGTEKSIKVKSHAANNTSYGEGIFYGSDDVTNTGYTLRVCDAKDNNCQDIKNNETIDFTTTSDDLIEIRYQASLVKRDEGVSAGISNAAITFEYIQD